MFSLPLMDRQERNSDYMSAFRRLYEPSSSKLTLSAYLTAEL